MKLFLRLAAAAAALLALVLIVAATPEKKVIVKDMVMPSQQLKFEPAMPGISKAVLWGDPAKGPYGAVTRFAKGTKVGWHTHPHDIRPS